MAESSSSSVGCSPSTFSDLTENGKNKTKIYCQMCGSLVLSPSNATMVEKEVRLNGMVEYDYEGFSGPPQNADKSGSSLFSVAYN